MKKRLIEKFKKIKVFITDFDGIHTDGHVYINQEGEESVRCSRKDGLAYNILKKVDIYCCVISKEVNPVVQKRCEKLGIDCYHKVNNGEGKLDIIKNIIKEKGVTSDEVLYMGDDLNDLEALSFVGLPITVSDSYSTVKKICLYKTKSKGGDHAIREVCELLMESKGLPLNF